VGLLEGQRLQQQRIHHAEDRRRRADPEGERQNDGQGKRRLPYELRIENLTSWSSFSINM
ncbi:MAG: hypothetical protein M3541_17235, partial [Acidobacteriota bacterium]|nr:hypothetical protein [Acidobacteriota bacterium]